MSLGIKSSAFLRVFTMGSWIHDGFLSSGWVPGFIIGLNKSVVYRAQSEVKIKKFMPMYK